MAVIQKRPGATGTKYRVLIRRKGQKAISKTFPTKTAADAWARKTEGAIDQRTYKDKRSLSGILFSDLIDLHIKHRRGIASRAMYDLERLRADLGREPAASVTDALLVDYARSRINGGNTGATVVRILALVSAVLKTASIVANLPVDLGAVGQTKAKLRHLGEDLSTGQRDRTMSLDEQTRVLGWLRQHGQAQLADIATVALGTAMRQGEICRIRWDDLDETRRVVLVRDRKDPKRQKGNDMEAPVLPERIAGVDAMAAIRRQPRTDARIFPVDPAKASKAWTAAMREMGIEDLKFHDLRHSSLTRCAAHGFGLPQLRLVSGHKSYDQLSRYVNLKADSVSLL